MNMDRRAVAAPTRELANWIAELRYADLPASMREYLESDARLWLEPPKDIAEVRRLQQ